MNNQYNAIEIGYEPNAHGLRLEGQHRVLCLGWADFLNRELGRWDLFSYYHLFTGNYVLCQWLDKDIKICKELETSFKSFENGGWSNLDFMRARLRPQEEIVAEMQSRQKKKASQEIYQRETDKEHKKDTVKWLGNIIHECKRFDYSFSFR